MLKIGSKRGEGDYTPAVFERRRKLMAKTACHWNTCQNVLYCHSYIEMFRTLSSVRSSKKVRGFLGSVRAFQGPIYLEPNFWKLKFCQALKVFFLCFFLLFSINFINNLIFLPKMRELQYICSSVITTHFGESNSYYHHSPENELSSQR